MKIFFWHKYEQFWFSHAIWWCLLYNLIHISPIIDLLEYSGAICHLHHLLMSSAVMWFQVSNYSRVLFYWWSHIKMREEPFQLNDRSTKSWPHGAPKHAKTAKNEKEQRTDGWTLDTPSYSYRGALLHLKRSFWADCSWRDHHVKNALLSL